ncbi:MAG: methyltransferase domain-containing protein [Thermoleophilaceae bacterium]
MDAAGWDRRYADSTRAFSSEPTPLLAELTSPLVAGRALDLAAGAGRNALWLAQRGWQVTAVDFSRVGLERAASRAAELGVELDCVHADLYDYRPAVAAFDLVLITYMHPQTDKRAAVFAAAAEAVAPGGNLLVIGFDETDPHKGGGPADPERRFSVSRLSGAFPGIELERCEMVTRERQTAEGPQRAVDTFAWGRRPDAS